MSLYEYFIEPILRNGWFNPINTITYSIILVIAVYLVYRLLQKTKVSIDRYFFLAILPFIFWGASTRVLHDTAVAQAFADPFLNNFFGLPIFPTPGSYIITFTLALFTLLLSLAVQRLTRFLYWKTMFSIGIALCIVNIILLPVTTLFPLVLVLSVTLLWTFLFLSMSRFVGKRTRFRNLFSYENSGILAAHFLDATATAFSLSVFGYLEQHVVPRLFIPIMGPAFAMFLLKILVVIPVLWLIDRYGEPGNFNNFLKIVVVILGLAPGLRDTLRLAAMV